MLCSELMKETTCAVFDPEGSAWVVAHQALSRLAKERAAADAEEGRWLLAALRSAAHVHLGFGSFSEYIERWFGYKPRSTHEKLRVAEALEGLPVIARALEEGMLHWSAARELTRVAVADTEREWMEAARGKSVRQLEDLVAGKRPGDDPSGPHQPSCATPRAALRGCTRDIRPVSRSHDRAPAQHVLDAGRRFGAARDGTPGPWWVARRGPRQLPNRSHGVRGVWTRPPALER